MQVRGLLVCDAGIVTSSRDKTIKVWARQPDASYAEHLTLVR